MSLFLFFPLFLLTILTLTLPTLSCRCRMPPVPDDPTGCFPGITAFCCSYAGGTFVGEHTTPPNAQPSGTYYTDDYDCVASSMPNRLWNFWECCESWGNEDTGARMGSDCACPVNCDSGDGDYVNASSYRQDAVKRGAPKFDGVCLDQPEIHQ